MADDFDIEKCKATLAAFESHIRLELLYVRVVSLAISFYEKAVNGDLYGKDIEIPSADHV